MSPRLASSAVALLMTLGTLSMAGATSPAALADPGTPGAPATAPGTTSDEPQGVPGTPSQDQVDAAAQAAALAATDVASVRAALVVADQRAEQAAVAAAQAAESYNGAVWAAEQATTAATAAQGAAAQAHSSVDAQREAYADAITRAYTTSPTLSALGAITRADGISDVLESTASLRNAESAFDQKYDDYRASATIADASSSAAQRSLGAAEKAAEKAASARADAQAAAEAAAAQTTAMAAQRDALLHRLAQLQDISYALAVNRQRGLEAQAHQAATAAAAQEAAKANRDAEEKGQAAPLLDDVGGTTYGDPLVSVPGYVPMPVPSLGPAPKPGKGAGFAIAFARAQIGEPYIWAAAGPDSWDCSGLTMGAWANGGKALPHYSVAQYAQSTPISPADLKPGDLVFWGRSNDPGSIYHVALYSGNGMIIQAPRSGVPVQEVSMFAWTVPNFYARP